MTRPGAVPGAALGTPCVRLPCRTGRLRVAVGSHPQYLSYIRPARSVEDGIDTTAASGQ